MSERAPFRTAARISFDEADPAGILFYGHVFSLAHRAFEEMLADAGIPWPEWFASATWTIPITHADAIYHAPLPAGRTADITVGIAEMRESGFSVATTFSLDGTECARVTTIHVFVDLATRTKRSIPEAFRAKLSAQQGA